ncbi:MAG: O-antigen ligase family protein [Actinomycetota bacterium]|nr:O-antigen ligase family protein [Actinomycetota bacterium]
MALLEFLRTDMSSRAKRIWGLAALGLCFGVPLTLTHPSAGLFAMTAYGGALAAFVIGYGEAQRGGDGFSLRKVLLVAGPLLALYGVLQYFFPLSAWDALWLESADLASIEAPEEDHIRVFSTLNSPQPLAAVLAVTLIFLVAVRRLSAGALLAAAVVAVGLSLTYARGAMLSVVAGLIALALATRGRLMPRMAAIVAACIASVVLLSPVSSTANAVLERATTFGGLKGDTSVEARSQTAAELFPVALAKPLGHGLGSIGEAARLSGSEGKARFLGADNGYLAVAWQLGPVGFFLVIGAVLWLLMITALTPVRGSTRFELKALVVSVLVLLLFYAAGQDIFYGVSGAIFWYLAGRAMWLADHARDPVPGAGLPPTGYSRRPSGRVMAEGVRRSPAEG